MALNKVTYTDDVTVIGAENLNDIQDAILDAEDKMLFGSYTRYGLPTWSGTDLNDLTVSGMYYADSVTTNAPHSSAYYFVMVISRQDGVGVTYVKQIAMRTTGSQIYTRTRSSDGTWGQWFEMVRSYEKGDTITFSNSALQQHPGQWYSKQQARLTIPLSRPIGSSVSSFSVTGDFLIHSNGSYGSYTFSSTVTALVEKITGGIGLRIDFGADQTIATSNTLLTFQPRNTFAITLA